MLFFFNSLKTMFALISISLQGLQSIVPKIQNPSSNMETFNDNLGSFSIGVLLSPEDVKIYTDRWNSFKQRLLQQLDTFEDNLKKLSPAERQSFALVPAQINVILQSVTDAKKTVASANLEKIKDTGFLGSLKDFFRNLFGLNRVITIKPAKRIAVIEIKKFVTSSNSFNKTSSKPTLIPLKPSKVDNSIQTDRIVTKKSLAIQTDKIANQKSLNTKFQNPKDSELLPPNTPDFSSFVDDLTLKNNLLQDQIDSLVSTAKTKDNALASAKKAIDDAKLAEVTQQALVTKLQSQLDEIFEKNNSEKSTDQADNDNSDRLQRQLNSAQEELGRLTQTTLTLNYNLAALQAEKQTALAEQARLTAELENQKNLLANAIQETNKFQQRATEALTRASEAEALVSALQEQLATATKTNQTDALTKNRELDRIRQAQRLAENALAAEEAKLKALNVEHTATLNDILNAHKNTLQDARDTAAAEMKTKQEELAALEVQLKDKSEILLQLEDEKKTHAAKLQDLQNNISNLTNSQTAAEAATKTKQAELYAVISELEQLKESQTATKNNPDYDASVDENARRISELESQSSGLQSALDTAIADKDLLNDKINNAHQLLSESINASQSAGRELITAQQEVAMLQIEHAAKIIELATKLDLAQKQLTAEKEEKTKLILDKEANASRFEEEKTKLQNEVTTQKTKIAAFKASQAFRDLATNSSAANTELLQKSLAAQADAELKLKNLTKTNTENLQTLNTLTEEKSNLQAQLQETEDVLAQLEVANAQLKETKLLVEQQSKSNTHQLAKEQQQNAFLNEQLKELNDLRTQQENAESQIMKQQKELATMRKQLMDNQKQSVEQGVGPDVPMSENNPAQNNITDQELNKLRQKITDQEQALKRKQDEIEIIKNDKGIADQYYAQNLSRQKQELELQINNIQTSLDKSRKFSISKKPLRQASQKSSQPTELDQAAEAENTNLTAQLQDLQKTLAQKNQDLLELAQKHDSEIQTLAAQLATSKEQITTQSEELMKKQSAFDNASKKLEKALTDNATREKEIATKEAEQLALITLITQKETAMQEEDPNSKLQITRRTIPPQVQSKTNSNQSSKPTALIEESNQETQTVTDPELENLKSQLEQITKNLVLEKAINAEKLSQAEQAKADALKDLETQATTFQSSRKDLQKQIIDLNGQISAQEVQAKSTGDTNKALQASLKSMKETLADATARQDTTEKTSREAQKTLQNELNSLKEILAKQLRANSALEKQITAQKNAITAANNATTAQNKNFDESTRLQSELTSLNLRLKTSEDLVKRSAQNLEKLDIAVKTEVKLRDQLSQMQLDQDRKNNQNTEEINKLNRELDNQRKLAIQMTASAQSASDNATKANNEAERLRLALTTAQNAQQNHPQPQKVTTSVIATQTETTDPSTPRTTPPPDSNESIISAAINDLQLNEEDKTNLISILENEALRRNLKLENVSGDNAVLQTNNKVLRDGNNKIITLNSTVIKQLERIESLKPFIDSRKTSRMISVDTNNQTPVTLASLIKVADNKSLFSKTRSDGNANTEEFITGLNTKFKSIAQFISEKDKTPTPKVSKKTKSTSTKKTSSNS